MHFPPVREPAGGGRPLDGRWQDVFPFREPEAEPVALFAVSAWSYALNVVVVLLGLLLMLIVLIQRGKGGGLAGALGGAGGSSPFGSRAADAFVKITLYLAAVWVIVIMIHVKVAGLDGRAAKDQPQVITGT